jgi:hypothetical protein
LRSPVEETVETPQAANPRGLVASVISDAQRLVALEIALARQELKEVITANAIAVGMVAFGGLLVVLGILVAIPTMVVLLVPWRWQAGAVWAIAYVVIGIVLALLGKLRFKVGLPKRTMESVKENRRWALRRIRSKGK